MFRMYGLFYGFALGATITGMIRIIGAGPITEIYFGVGSMVFGFFMLAVGRIVQVLEQIRDKVGE